MIVAEASAVRSIASIAFSTLRNRNLPVSAMGRRILTREASRGRRRPAARRPAVLRCHGSRPRPSNRALSASRTSSSCRRPSAAEASGFTRRRAAQRGQDSSTLACRPLAVWACSPRASRRISSSRATGPDARASPSRSTSSRRIRASRESSSICQASRESATARRAGQSRRWIQVAFPEMSFASRTSRFWWKSTSPVAKIVCPRGWPHHDPCTGPPATRATRLGSRASVSRSTPRRSSSRSTAAACRSTLGRRHDEEA